MKLLSIVGARPQFIKVKPVIDACQKLRVGHRLIHTGQHYDFRMSKLFFSELNIPAPNHHLKVPPQSPLQQTAQIIACLDRVLLKERPDWVLVYGDTTSTLAAGVATAKLQIPLAHVEAGLRSYRKDMPEEFNRVVTDQISDILFCPTQRAVDNLKKEGRVKGVHRVGDVMYDLSISQRKILDPNILLAWNVLPGEYHVLTVHRHYNTDEIKNLITILKVLEKTKLKVIFPIHPRAKKALRQSSVFKKSHLKNIQMIDPVGYLEMQALIRYAKSVLTDSGGVQKESYFLQVPCITLRDETEWPETLKGGWNVLTGAHAGKIQKALKRPKPRMIPQKAFGNGHSVEKMIKILKNQ